MAQIMIRIMWLALAAVFLVSPVEAGLIIDTGTPSGANQFNFGVDPEARSSGLGGRIYLDKTYDISRLEGYLINGATDANNTCFAVIYQDGTIIDFSGYNPGQIISYYSVTVPANNVAGWYGADTPSLRLAAGWYWLAFEMGAEFYGAMLGDSPNPLSLEARTWSGIDGPWSTDLSPLNLGVRVYGEPVPVPAAIFLLGSGLLGLAGLRGFKKG